MRMAPRPRTAVLVFLGYLVVFYGVWAITGVDYTRIGDTADTVLKWYVAPLLFGAVFLVIAVTALGWWRPALLETQKATPRWRAAAAPCRRTSPRHQKGPLPGSGRGP